MVSYIFCSFLIRCISKAILSATSRSMFLIQRDGNHLKQCCTECFRRGNLTFVPTFGARKDLRFCSLAFSSGALRWRQAQVGFIRGVLARCENDGLLPRSRRMHDSRLPGARKHGKSRPIGLLNVKSKQYPHKAAPLFLFPLSFSLVNHCGGQHGEPAKNGFPRGCDPPFFGQNDHFPTAKKAHTKQKIS